MLKASFVDGYKDRPVPWGFDGLSYAVYKRTYARPVYEDGVLVRSEEWWETVRRVVDGAEQIGAGLTESESERLYDHIFNLRGCVSGRALWQMGTDNVRRLGAESLTNCWFVNLASIEDFGWLFERLMLGGGVGFSVRESGKLGKVQASGVIHLPDAKDADFIVPDKREGWAELLKRVLRAYLPDAETSMAPQDFFTYSTVLVRPEGAPIKTFGGIASGPGILVEGVDKIVAVLDGAVGRELKSVEVLDIANIIGGIVVSGNVRRSAQIALGSPKDEEFLQAKRWDLGNVPSWRAMSNNSVMLAKPSQLGPAFWAGYEGEGEPYGLFNKLASQAYGRTGERMPDDTIVGTNPCAEIGLGHRESCNLAEVFLPRLESLEQFKDIARLLYKVQKAVAALGYLDEESAAITAKNMRLGLGVTGVAMAGEKLDWLDPVYRYLRGVDVSWSEVRGWPESVRLTTVKPSGTLSLLAGVTPGVHGGYARYHIRRVRFAYNDPMLEWCRQRGYRWEHQVDFEGQVDERTVIVEFPCAFPEGTLLASEMSAVEQLDLQARLQAEWADNAVSVTVTFKPEELPDIKAYLDENWDRMKSVSFLRYSGHGFDQAPLEPITREQYLDMLAAINRKDIEVAAGLSEVFDEECSTGACPIR